MYIVYYMLFQVGFITFYSLFITISTRPTTYFSMKFRCFL